MFAEKYLFACLSLAIVLLVLQAGLISGLLIKRGRQRRAVAEPKESEHDLTGLLLRTQDEERRRIALELHDVTAQSIGLILLNLSQVQSAMSSMDQKTKDKVTESLIFGEQALKDIRTLSYVLHPPLLDQAGLTTALKWYVRGFR